MNKKIVIASLAMASLCSAASVFADDGKVNFSGEIIDSACTVVNDLSNPLEVTMGQVSKTAFNGRDADLVVMVNCQIPSDDLIVHFF